MLATSRTTAHHRGTSRRNPLGRYTPKRVNEHSRWRFFRARRAEAIQRVSGSAPNERQALAIEMLVKSQWHLFVAERAAADATDTRARAEALRIANDSRKQVLLWHRELTAASPLPAPPGPPDITDILAEIASRRALPDAGPVEDASR
jgi:hypothetical protein